MKEQKIQFILEKDEQKEIKGGLPAPNCNSWWDTNSQCEHEKGCITPSWSSIKK